MKKTKLILTSAVMFAALSFAYASSDVRRFDYFYYPGDDTSGTPQPTTSTKQCTVELAGCTENIPGESGARQLYILKNGEYIAVKQP